MTAEPTLFAIVAERKGGHNVEPSQVTERPPPPVSLRPGESIEFHSVGDPRDRWSLRSDWYGKQPTKAREAMKWRRGPMTFEGWWRGLNAIAAAALVACVVALFWLLR